MTCLFLPHIVAATVLAGALMGTAQAADYRWDASSGLRPDQVGSMDRVATGLGPSDTLVPGGALRLGTGDVEEWMFYMAIGRQLDMPEQLDLSFTARLVDISSVSPLRSPLAVVANLVGGRGVVIEVTDGAVSLLRYDDLAFSSTYRLDTRQFHDYRLVVSGPQNGAPIDLYVDGVKRLRDNVNQGSLYTPHARIVFGDSSFAAGGTSEWLSFSHNAAAVPEPQTWALWLLGFGVTAAGLWRRRSSDSRHGEKN